MLMEFTYFPSAPVIIIALLLESINPTPKSSGKIASQYSPPKKVKLKIY